MKLSTLFLVSVLLVACGKRGDPKPPVPNIPKGTSDLVVTQRGSKVILSWSYPALTVAGTSLRDLKRILVYRYTEELPPDVAGRDVRVTGGESGELLPPEAAAFSKIPVLAPTQFRKLREQLAELGEEEIGKATSGSRLVLTDEPPMRTSDGRPVRLTYGVIAESVDARSELSNLVTLVAIEPAMPPRNSRVTAEAAGVTLSWDAPDQTMSGRPDPFVAGYNIYRTTDPAPFPDVPVNPSPVTETSFKDAPPYGNYSYSVRSVAVAGPALVEGEATSPVTLAFGDRVGPPVPENVTVLTEAAAVRLLWDAVESDDLVGYLVFRTTRGETKQLTAEPVTETYFRDPTLAIGTGYVYSVVSVDRSGNRSEPARGESVTLSLLP